MMGFFLTVFVLLFLMGIVVYKRGVMQGKGEVVDESEKALPEWGVYEIVSSAHIDEVYIIVLRDTVTNKHSARLMKKVPPRKFRVIRRGFQLVYDAMESDVAGE